MKTKVIEVETVGDAYSSGLLTVTLQRGDVTVQCEGITTWEGDELDAYFYDWLALAQAGEEGYTIL